jgi:hypothetical protein
MAGGSSAARAGSGVGGSGGGAASAGGTSGAGTSGAGTSGAGTSGAGGFPSLNLTDDARKLSDADKGLLCDWINETLGGYATTTDCGGAIMKSNDRDRAQCVMTRFRYNCKVTVQEVRECTLASAPSHGCNTDFQECHPIYCIE